MKELSKEEMLKEMEKYGYDEEKIMAYYEDSGKEVAFDEYIRLFYLADRYIQE